MRFSQRYGYEPVRDTLQIEDMSQDLRNSLWNVLRRLVFSDVTNVHSGGYSGVFREIAEKIWELMFKRPIDDLPGNPYECIKVLKRFVLETATWNVVYDFVEFIVQSVEYNKAQQLQAELNTVLRRELAGYRLVDGLITTVTDEREVSALEEALEDHRFPGVKSHLRAALAKISDRQNPDPRNAIKESISAVESLARAVTGNPKATLGDALKELERQEKLHPALKQGFSSLYGYTNDEEGIRHAMMKEPNLTTDDAKFFLLSCTSFINYLKAKLA